MSAGFLGLWLAIALGADAPDYQREVKPLLMKRCGMCHGVLRQEGGLRLDVVQLARRGGDSGPVIVAGAPDQSRLIQALTGAEGVSKMPEDGPPLRPEEIELLRRWIAAGAVADDEPVPADPRRHWSFIPPSRQPLPTAPAGASLQNGVDAFLAQAHHERGLLPLAESSRDALLRRVTWDLVGRPPTETELLDFRGDSAPDAYEQVVERLLASPAYGERWARHWMDVWRYSDWYGYAAELRNSARHTWRWRDWIIAALNADKPYDRMIQEMLAGDELDPLNEDALRATGFLARNYYKFNRDVWLDNTVEHTSKAFLGLTLNCSRCHHHVYDPFPQQAYYELRAVFEPYQVRTDRLPGEADVAKVGLTRVYDANPEAPTFLYVRGNDKQPVKDKPLSPRVPEFLLGRQLEIAPVALPAVVRFPGLQPFVQREARQQAEQAVEAARRALASAESQLAAAQARLAPLLDLPADALAPGGPHPDAKEPELQFRDAAATLELARKRLSLTEAEVAAVEARIAADVARYSDPPAADADALARVAAQAERQQAVRKAEAEVAQAEVNLIRAEIPPPKGATGKPKTPAELQKARETALQQLAQAQTALTEKTAAYTSLTDAFPATSTGRRLALARWITDRAHPLTARVAVNHIWLRHFGEPLVETVFDFGHGGKPPALPELLDWLAVEFMDSGWSMKHVHRLLVTSAAYRRSSSLRGAASDTLARDPDNRSWWRMPLRRLESEAVRDGLLFAAAAVDDRLGGPELDAKDGLKTQRRSVYYRHAPEKTMEFLDLFDGPPAVECYRRNSTIVPQQALALANSTLSFDMARRLATTIGQETAGGATATGDFVVTAFRRVLSRDPSADELRLAHEFLLEQPERLRQAAGRTPSEKPVDWAQRARENLVHVLFNHHDFVTIR